MASDKYSGILKVEYATAGTSFGTPVDLGDCLADSAGYKRETKTVETGAGTMLYAGNQDSFECKVLDATKFSALETIMKADGKIDIRITTIDNSGSPVTVILNGGVIVSKNYGMKVGERNYFTLKSSVYAI